MIWLVLIAVVLVGLVAGSLWGGLRAVRHAGQAGAAAAADRLRVSGFAADRIRPARCLGHTVGGVPALRGDGALALDRRRLRFQLALPDHAFDLALADVAHCEITPAGGRSRPLRHRGAPPDRVVIRCRDGAQVTLLVDATDLWPELLAAGGNEPREPGRPAPH